MSDAEWDADDFEVPKATTVKVVSDKWEGEDEDDDVKDAWDNSDDEDNSKASEGSDSAVRAMQRKKKKKIADIIAEKEAAKVKEQEDKAQAQAAAEAANTPEARLAEKLRQQKIAEIEALNMAKDLMGVKSGSIDAMVPATKEEFDTLTKAIVEKVQIFSSASYYNDFVENLIKELTLDQPVPTLKKLKIHVETLHSTKLKEEKSKSKGKPSVTKGRTTVRMDLDKDIFGGGGAGGKEAYDDMDDFM